MNKYQVRRLPLTFAISSVIAASAAQAATITVDSSLDGPPGTYDTVCTLRSAIVAANSGEAVDGCPAGSSGADQIEFDQSLADSTITLSSGQLEITGPVKISGPVAGSAAGISISGADLQRVFRIEGTTAGDFEVTLDSLSFVNGYYYDGAYFRHYGAGIYASDVDLTIRDVVASGHYAYYGGGSAIRFKNGSLLIERSTISNSGGGYFSSEGGGLYAAGAEAMIIDSAVTNNSVGYIGGGMAFGDSYSIIQSSDISGNSTISNFGIGGAGITINHGSLSLIDSTVTANSTGGYSSGAGIHSIGGSVEVLRSQVSNNSISLSNSSSYIGGGIYVWNNHLTLTDSTVSGNYAGASNFSGGGIGLSQGNLYMLRSRVTANSVLSDAQGVYSDMHGSAGLYLKSGTFMIRYSEISDNELVSYIHGTAGLAVDSGQLTVINTTLSGNDKFGTGTYSYDHEAIGGLYLSNETTASFIHATIANNSADGNAPIAGIAADELSNFELINSIVSSDAIDLCNKQASVATYSLTTDTSCGEQATSNADLVLQPLGDHGGPTYTHALGHNSIAIEAAGDCESLNISQDQRGFQRPAQGSQYCDAGAFEFTEYIFRDRFEP